MIGAKPYLDLKYWMQVLQKNSYTRLKPEICNSGYQKLSQHQQLQKKEIEGVGKAPQDPLYIFKAFFVLTQKQQGQEACISLLSTKFETIIQKAARQRRYRPRGCCGCILAISYKAR